jgi:hypothetical protein
MAIALAVQLTFAFVACILLTILCWETTISVDDTLSSKATAAAAGPVAYAQTTDNTNSATSSNSEDVDAAVANNKNITTFSGIGQISSLVITVPESGFNITDAFKVILTGEWNLNVRNGNVTEFAVNFLASPMDGSKPHIHQITDFRPYDNSGEPIALTRDYSLSVTGTADIKINGVTIWEDADVSISISKGNTFIFDPDDLATEDHFGDQQVYGIVTGLFS